MELLARVLRTEVAAGRPCVAEANFRGVDLLPEAAFVQVYCDAPADELAERYAGRDRHPGHLDVLRPPPDPEEYGPLPLVGPLLRFSVGDDVAALVECVRRCVA